MSTKKQIKRWRQILGWSIASLFVLGNFVTLVGEWTGPILGVWFVGTQKPRRGFVWLVALTFLPKLVSDWRRFPLTGPEQAVRYAGWMLIAAVVGAIPFLFHRLAGPRLPGFLSTLPLPLAGALLAAVWRPAGWPQPHLAAVYGAGGATFLVYWFAAAIVWMWNHQFRASKIAVGASVFAAVCALAAGTALLRVPPLGAALSWICLGGAIALSAWALLHPGKQRVWAGQPETVATLRSPFTGERLQVAGERNREALVSASGERFPIREGIPVFLRPEDLTGLNLKYNHLYETIGGFYDDIQRVVTALTGMDRDEYVRSYLGLLEVKPGDSVLETSVGTGLNFKYLPRDIKRTGLDLSAEMLANCQANLRRWEMDAGLFLGNAESLPFADSSFDAVFHVGGINFFSDRAKAIREMVRVARPGSLILIADETEEHVKGSFERSPIAGGYYRGREEKVTAPIDMVPAEMQEVRLESIWSGRFYALTFRKPAGVEAMVR